MSTSPYNYVDPYTGQPQPFKRALPLGGQYTTDLNNLSGQTLRGQLNFNKIWAQKHELVAIVGAEFKSSYATAAVNRYYGYNEVTKQYNNRLDFLREDLPSLDGGIFQPDYGSTFQDNRQRAISEFANVSYTYDSRYTLSASARRDGSNVFGVATNNSFSPFYSLGGLWNIANEKFYKLTWLPSLKLRATFGYNGNVNYTTSPYPQLGVTATTGANGLRYAFINGMTNNSLRPEKTGILNLGVDFGLSGNQLSGTIEFYTKKNKDIISSSPIDPTTGLLTTAYNSANMKSEGIDITLNAILIGKGSFRWTNTTLFSYNRSKITAVFTTPTILTPNNIIIGGTKVPDYDVNPIFAYKWAGLSNTGAPQYIDDKGNVSTDYLTRPYTGLYYGIANYVGSATPIYYGAYRNTVSYKGFALSANLIYKLGYYFRRPDAINYNAVAFNSIYLSAEYGQRWQKPGDEVNTNVPAFNYPITAGSDAVYRNADINVLKGDHIRLKEINFSYTLNKPEWKIKHIQISGNIQNLGIIWRANKQGYDPDILDVPRPRSYTIGLNANF
jgi:hypothetical protein